MNIFDVLMSDDSDVFDPVLELQLLDEQGIFDEEDV